MILSASRRTDIPAFYADWFFRRVSEGYAVTRNPMNPTSEKRISLLPEDVDGIVLWSKNPTPMLGRLGELARYRYYFQFTLTPYETDIEPGIPAKADVVDAFRRLSDAIGPERVLWRYDPILINPRYTVDRHMDQFERLASALSGYTRVCTLSFIDPYRNTRANAAELALTELDDEGKRAMAGALASIASAHGIEARACAERIDFAPQGVSRARCVDARLFNALWGLCLPVRKASGQRRECGCTQSVDIGAYNTCPGGCLYCYANYLPKRISQNRQDHNPLSSSLST